MLPKRRVWLLRAMAAVTFGVIVAANAWLCDDAYITFRQVDNLLSGRGFVWNVGERVQAFTHPLWALLLVPIFAVSGEVFFAPMVVGIALAVATAWVLVSRVVRRPAAIIVVAATLCLSRAVVDYSTSGLENGLSHLLLVSMYALLYVRPLSRRALLVATGLGGLVLLNRLDLVLVVGPMLAGPLWQARKGISLSNVAVPLAAPLLVWESFSLVYYGFLFPNTAYAKLGAGIDRTTKFVLGGEYALASFHYDPVGCTAWLVGFAMALRTPKLRGIAIAMVLYCFYTFWMGGDFMAGRFYAAPALLAVCVIGHTARFDSPARLTVAAVLLTAAGYATPISTLGVPPDLPYSRCRGPRGPSDERCVFGPHTALMRHPEGPRLPVHPWTDEGVAFQRQPDRPHVARHIGFTGYHAGPDIYVVDIHALSDPFLARLPARRQVTPYSGHFMRHIDPAYLAALRTGTPDFTDPRLNELFSRLQNIVRGPLWSSSRWRDILFFNLGRYEDLVDPEPWRYPNAKRVAVNGPKVPDGALPGAPGTSNVNGVGAVLPVPGGHDADWIELAVSGGSRWIVEFREGERALRMTIDADRARGMTRRRLEIPPPWKGRLERVRILPASGHHPWWVGDAQVEESAPRAPTAEPQAWRQASASGPAGSPLTTGSSSIAIRALRLRFTASRS